MSYFHQPINWKVHVSPMLFQVRVAEGERNKILIVIPINNLRISFDWSNALQIADEIGPLRDHI